MWKNFSRDDLAHTPTAVRTMALSALAASFFLALLCGLFYNAWAYEVDRVLREEGSWQARLTLTDGAQAETLEQFAQVDTVTPDEGLSGPDALVVELTFRDKTAVYDTLGLIRDRLGLDDDQIQTHDTFCLSMESPIPTTRPCCFPSWPGCWRCWWRRWCFCCATPLRSPCRPGSTGWAFWPAWGPRPVSCAFACCRRPLPSRCCRWR